MIWIKFDTYHTNCAMLFNVSMISFMLRTTGVGGGFAHVHLSVTKLDVAIEINNY